VGSAWSGALLLFTSAMRDVVTNAGAAVRAFAVATGVCVFGFWSIAELWVALVAAIAFFFMASFASVQWHRFVLQNVDTKLLPPRSDLVTTLRYAYRFLMITLLPAIPTYGAFFFVFEEFDGAAYRIGSNFLSTVLSYVLFRSASWLVGTALDEVQTFREGFVQTRKVSAQVLVLSFGLSLMVEAVIIILDTLREQSTVLILDAIFIQVPLMVVTVALMTVVHRETS